MTLSEEHKTILPDFKGRLSVALVEPRIPQNTGNIARLCACTGAELYVIGSLGFRMSDKHLMRSGMDYLDDLEIIHLADLETLKNKKPNAALYYLSTKANQSYTEIEYPDEVILVFGSETHGLPETLIENNLSSCLKIPMQPEARSLNLSNSVAIVMYETLRQWQISGCQSC